MSAKYVASSNELLRLKLKQSTAERRIQLADYDVENWFLDWNCATVNQIAAHLITESEMQDEAIKCLRNDFIGVENTKAKTVENLQKVIAKKDRNYAELEEKNEQLRIIAFVISMLCFLFFIHLLTAYILPSFHFL